MLISSLMSKILSGADVRLSILEYYKSDVSDEVRKEYSKYVDDTSHDANLDSDELTWVQSLRKEKESYNKKLLKPWSPSEEKRSKEMTKFISDRLNAGDEFCEFYEENVLQEYPVVKLSFPGYKDDECSITKMNLIYTKNWDENDNCVKKGKAVPGTVYYMVQTDDGAIDETTWAYKTYSDAEHAMNLFIQDLRKFREKQ